MRITFLLLVFVSPIIGFSQDAIKMKKHLTVFVTDKYKSNIPVCFERENPNKHGWDNFSEIFKTAFVSRDFKILTVSDTCRKYIIEMDYDYGYAIYAYRMQCANLKGRIIDINNNREIIGTINYNGRFEIENVATAIAIELKIHSH